MDHPFLPILVVLVVGCGFSALFLGLSALIGPKKGNPSKLSPYECGLKPIGGAREQLDVKFYLLAMLFILFDIEAVFLFPWAIVYRDYVAKGQGLFLFSEMGVFLVILAVGLIYVWRKGALDWNNR